MSELPEVEIFTDGGAMPNPGPGGWAAILRAGERCKELSGYEPETTNNRMELTAAVRALEALKRPCQVQLYTDSEYLQKGISEWLPVWKRRGWMTASRKPVKNQDLWQTLVALIDRHEVNFHWLKGHAGHPQNERCDALVGEAIRRKA